MTNLPTLRKRIEAMEASGGDALRVFTAQDQDWVGEKPTVVRDLSGQHLDYEDAVRDGHGMIVIIRRFSQVDDAVAPRSQR